ncbi:MAG: adenine-specific methyltransferase EcoRI family protein [Paludibacteraceae bacterium]|nr:adenine-specific methyltransferase EcoRI family protein [Paludibacteraceae bacterium]
MAGNKTLSNAKDAKNDEFYTQLEDIEKELKHYREHFNGKTVFCNCDDPYESNFFKYFAMNFNALGLKKLIATCYNGSPVQGNELLLQFDLDAPDELRKVAHKIEISEVKDANGDGAVDLKDVRYLLQNDKNVISILKGNGDFRSPECVELLKQADIVVTNPPFSLFREYVAQLVKYEKQFIILGNMNAITYKEIFPLIIKNQLWTGYGFNMSMVYKTPYKNNLEANKKYVLSKGYNPDENYIKVPAVNWYTNINTSKRAEEIILYKSYISEEYPKYETFDAIDVSSITDIPYDYYGIMGVPKTFLDKYNPDQFEIIGYEREDENIKIGIKNMPEDFLKKYREQGGRGHYTKGMKMLCFYDKDGNAKIPFSRILIKRKKL